VEYRGIAPELQPTSCTDDQAAQNRSRDPFSPEDDETRDTSSHPSDQDRAIEKTGTKDEPVLLVDTSLIEVHSGT
jgi:hypothetical protein